MVYNNEVKTMDNEKPPISDYLEILVAEQQDEGNVATKKVIDHLLLEGVPMGKKGAENDSKSDSE